jgi:hypothetical protein
MSSSAALLSQPFAWRVITRRSFMRMTSGMTVTGRLAAEITIEMLVSSSGSAPRAIGSDASRMRTE